MFSNRSVSVQPSAPPIEYAGVPDSLSVFASVRNCAHVDGALTPASVNDLTLYQTVDLLARLDDQAVEVAVDLAELLDVRRVVGEHRRAREVHRLQRPFFWKSTTRPGCETDARSGGLPPCTAVESTVGVLSPVERYVTLTFGYFSLNPSRTAWKCCCSAPVQTPTILMFPYTLDDPDVVAVPPLELVVLLLDFLLPQAASESAATTSRAASAIG